MQTIPPQVPAVAASLTADPSLARPQVQGRRVSRAGSVVMLVGFMTFSAAMFVAADNVYMLFVGHAYNVGESNLFSGYTGLLTGLGVLLIAIGWVTDRAATRTALLANRPRSSDSSWIPGLVVTLTGVALIVAFELFTAALEFGSYYGVNLGASNTTLVVGYSGEALGILVLGIGWFIHHWFSLSRIESARG